MTGRDKSTYELADDIHDILAKIEDLNTKVDNLHQIFLPREVYDAKHEALRSETALTLKSLEIRTSSALMIARTLLGIVGVILTAGVVYWINSGGT